MIHGPPAPSLQSCSAIVSSAHERLQAAQQLLPQQQPSEPIAVAFLVYCFLSPRSAPVPPPATSAGLLTHICTHCYTLLLQQPYVSSPARCSAGSSRCCLKTRQCIPRKLGTTSAVLLLMHEHVEGVTPRHGHELHEWHSGSGWQRRGLGRPYKLVGFVFGEAQMLILTLTA